MDMSPVVPKRENLKGRSIRTYLRTNLAQTYSIHTFPQAQCVFTTRKEVKFRYFSCICPPCGSYSEKECDPFVNQSHLTEQLLIIPKRAEN